MMSRSLKKADYLNVLKGAVYSLAKAEELSATFDVLGYNWFNLKEQLKTIRLSREPALQNKMLAKPRAVNLELNARGLTTSVTEINLLLKLLPFFDIDLTTKSSDLPEAKQARRLLGIAKSEADMM